MKIERSVIRNISENKARELVVRHLLQAGYKQITEEKALTFRRGSLLGTWTSFNPQGWNTKATVEISPQGGGTRVAVVFDINTTGQWVTDKERTFWNNEFDDLEAVIRGKIVSGNAGKAFAKSASSQSKTASIIIIILSVTFYFSARLSLNSRIAGLIGSVIGLVLGFMITNLWLKMKIRNKLQ